MFPQLCGCTLPSGVVRLKQHHPHPFGLPARRMSHFVGQIGTTACPAKQVHPILGGEFSWLCGLRPAWWMSRDAQNVSHERLIRWPTHRGHYQKLRLRSTGDRSLSGVSQQDNWCMDSMIPEPIQDHKFADETDIFDFVRCIRLY